MPIVKRLGVPTANISLQIKVSRWRNDADKNIEAKNRVHPTSMVSYFLQASNIVMFIFIYILLTKHTCTHWYILHKEDGIYDNIQATQTSKANKYIYSKVPDTFRPRTGMSHPMQCHTTVFRYSDKVIQQNMKINRNYCLVININWLALYPLFTITTTDCIGWRRGVSGFCNNNWGEQTAFGQQNTCCLV